MILISSLSVIISAIYIEYILKQNPCELCIYQRYNCSNSGVCTATNDPSAPFSSLEECEASGCGEPSPMATQPRKQRLR